MSLFKKNRKNSERFTKKTNKFSNKKREYKGIKFDSATELEFYKILLEFKSRGELKDVIAHPEKLLILPGQYVEIPFLNSRKKEGKCVHREMYYNPDILIVLNNNRKVYIDIKSFATLTPESINKFKTLSAIRDIHILILFRESKPYLEDIIKYLEKGYCEYMPLRKKALIEYLEKLRHFIKEGG